MKRQVLTFSLVSKLNLLTTEVQLLVIEFKIDKPFFLNVNLGYE